MFKRIITLAILSVTVLAGMSGCGDSPNINLVAIEYMEQKYGETFEYTGAFGDSMTGTHQLRVQCAGFPGQDIIVQVENYRTDDKIFSDNYLAVKYYQDTLNFLFDSANLVFGEAGAFSDINTLTQSPDLPADATFEQYLADTSAPLVLMVEVKESVFVSGEQAYQLAELMAAYGTYFYISLVIVHDSDYGTFDSDTLEDYASQNLYVYFAAIANTEDGIDIRWHGLEWNQI